MTHQRAASYGRERKTNKFSAGSDGDGGVKTTICSEVFKVCNVFIISIITRVGVPIDLSARNSHAFYCYFPLCITFAVLASRARALSPTSSARHEKYENKLHVIRGKITVFRRC